MSDKVVTESMLEQTLEKAFRKNTDEILGVIYAFMEQVDKRFNKLEQGQEKLEQGQEKLEKGLTKADFSIFRLQEDVSQIKQDVTDLKASHERLLNTLDGYLKRLDSVETEQTFTFDQFKRLVAWAHKVSAKTGIPLKDL